MLQRRFKDFGEDMRDVLGIGSVLQFYIGNDQKRLFNLKKIIKSEEDAIFNISKIKEALTSNGIMPLPELIDQKPSAREMLLFLVHLYQVLPHYLPKDTLKFPLILGGTCTRHITL